MKTLKVTYLVLLVCMTVLLGIRDGMSQSVDETALKAAFVYRFVQFTDFPQTRDDCRTMCLLGESDVTMAIENYSGRKAHGLPLHFEKLSSPVIPAGQCDALFVGIEDRMVLRRLVNSKEGESTLIISDAPDAIDENVDIALFSEPNKIRFSVNVSRAKKRHFSFSSQMLKLAKKIY